MDDWFFVEDLMDLCEEFDEEPIAHMNVCYDGDFFGLVIRVIDFKIDFLATFRVP